MKQKLLPDDSMKIIRNGYCRPLALEVLQSPMSIPVFFLVRRILPIQLLLGCSLRQLSLGEVPCSSLMSKFGHGPICPATFLSLPAGGPERQQISWQFFSGQGSSGAVLTGDEISTSDGQQQSLLPASTIGLSPIPITGAKGGTKQQSVCQIHQAAEDHSSDGSDSIENICLHLAGRVRQRKSLPTYRLRILQQMCKEGVYSLEGLEHEQISTVKGMKRI